MEGNPSSPSCSPDDQQIPDSIEARDFAVSVEGRPCSPSCKATKFGDLMDGRVPRQAEVKRWDGAARTCSAWDGLRRDPELWFKNGNCFVHLYGRGQSRRGPAFKVPFSALISAKCQPLVKQFILQDVAESPSPTSSDCEADLWSRASLARKVELYIPAPPMSSKDQALQYHLATRNLFAWVFRRSVVGDHLGSALVGLLSSMQEFRSADATNVEDLLSYLDEEGYLDVRNQPNHALAVLHLAESFQLRDLYIHAFAHCAGMSDRLFMSSEYQQISSVSRKLIRRARVDMDLRLGLAGTMLRTFLEDDLDEAHLGLAPGARAHLDRFRAYIQGFYMTKLGYYPPPSTDARAAIFEPLIYRVMREDFEGLYEYIVDENFTTAESSPFLAQGGLCTVQSVHSFDLRHKFKSLDHPLPLLPEPRAQSSRDSRRMSWLSRPDKLSPDRRLVEHAALLKATNKRRMDLLRNDLVLAYRSFEENMVFAPLKVDKAEKVSQADGRKVRWILIYAVYQTLRSCTEVPPEVRDVEGTSYHLAVSTDSLPPWKEEPVQSLLPRHMDDVTRLPSSSTAWSSVPATLPEEPRMLEIKPDIDYSALTHRASAHERPATRDISSGPPVVPPRSMSLSAGLDRAGTIRRSFSRFTGQNRRESMPVQNHSRRPSYHEIVVLGYGNGTNVVHISAHNDGDNNDHGDAVPHLPAELAAPASRSVSTSSSSSTGSAASASSSLVAESPRTDYSSSTWAGSRRGSLADQADGAAEKEDEACYHTLPRRTFSPSSIEALLAMPGSKDDTALTPPPPALPRRSSKRLSNIIPNGGGDGRASLFTPPPLRIRKERMVASLPENPDEWTEVQVVLDAECERLARRRCSDGLAAAAADDIMPAWEQFADLGGLCPALPIGRR